MRMLLLCALSLALPAAVLDDGIKALDEQRYADAAALFEKAVAEDGQDYVAHFHLALAQSLLGKTELAITGYEKTLALKPGLGEAEMNLGILLAGAGQTARAQTLLIAALAKTPDSASGLLALGRALMAQGKLEEAEQKLVRAAALEPRYSDGLLELANEYEKVKNWDAAERLYKPQAANPEVAERLGVLYLAAGKPGDAVPVLESAVKGSPSSANRYALAIAYLRTQQSAKALPMLEQASGAEPGNLDLRLAYGRALRDQRKFAPAAEQFFAATKLNAGSAEAWSEFAGMLLMLEDYPRALTAYDRLQALGENSAGLHFFRAICQDRMKLVKESLASYEKFLALSAGANPDQEFQARQRVQTLKRELAKR